MNLKTITFDADKWQLVPKVATDEMIKEMRCWEITGTQYKAALAAAPQPPELSPWLPEDEK